VNFFDHGFMVNRILWGQYHAIAQDAVTMISQVANQTVAGVSCAYGEFFPKLAEQEAIENLCLFDIAPIQIKQMQKKIPSTTAKAKCHFFLSDAEKIALANESVDTSVLFFLLHELPSSHRANVLAQTIQVTKAGGRVVIADYGQSTKGHTFHKNKIFSSVFEKMEPFLANFWRCDLLAELNEQAEKQGRTIKLTNEKYYFNRFYRLLEFVVE
jgi:ubiquinone/menaquinone biosynthesis C-methylase UbiE